jgi:uncharacterized membrane protein
MSILGLVRMIAILSSGLFAGLMFGDRMGPAYGRPVMSASSFIQQQQIVHIHYLKLLPPLSMAAVLSVLGWLILTRASWKTAGFWLVALAALAIVSATVLTLRVNFPINAQLVTWNASNPPENFREIWSPWEKAHTVRTVLWLGAFALEVVALSLFASRNPNASGN